MARKVQITDNWMSTVSSPTYKLSLYLVHPDVWNEPLTLMQYTDDLSDLRRGGKAVLIAENGVTTEYAIDNLTIMSFYGPSPDSGSVQSGVFQFNLTEPLGFKLLNRILRYSTAFNFKTIQHALYVLKVEFMARDPETSRPIKYPGEFFYSLQIKQIQAQVTEMGTRYNIIAHNVPKTASSLCTLKMPVKIPNVKKVNDLLTSLEKACNEAEVKLRKDAKIQDPKSNHKWKFVLDDSVKFTVTQRIDIPQNPDGSGHKIFSEKFDLGSQSYASTGNSGSAGGQNRKLSDETSVDEFITVGSNVVDWLQQELTKNVPAFAQLNKKQRQATDNILKSHITVTPNVTYGSATDQYTNTQERVITVTVGIGNTYATPQTTPKAQEEKVNNRENQKKWFAEMPITKRYDYLYSGLNTEILSFNMNIEAMLYSAMDPAAGLNYASEKESKVPTNPTPVTVGSAERLTNQDGIPTTDYRERKGNTRGFATFLSEIPASNQQMFENMAYTYQMSSASSQQLNEAQGKDTGSLDALADLEFKHRDLDFQQIELKIKGDPFWMGTPGVKRTESVIAADAYLMTDSLILLTNYMPTQVTGRNFTYEYQGKGEFDIAASGVYEVRSIQTEMSGGEFIQTLKCFRNRNISSYLLQNEMEVRRS